MGYLSGILEPNRIRARKLAAHTALFGCLVLSLPDESRAEAEEPKRYDPSLASPSTAVEIPTESETTTSTINETFEDFLARTKTEAQPPEETEDETGSSPGLHLAGFELLGTNAELQVFGFADFYASSFFFPEESAWNRIFISYPAFGVGNLNLYLSGTLGDRWSSLIEVRLLYVPSGSVAWNRQTGEVSLATTSVIDPRDPVDAIEWGGIRIERAYLQFDAFPFLKIRAGHWLTPYGIWNVDHGSPTTIGTRLPVMISYEIFPRSQTGIAVLGDIALPDETFEYTLTLSNGTSSFPLTNRDIDNNKAIGGRIEWRTRWLDELTLGVSGYFGAHSERSGRIKSGTIYSTFVDVDWQLDRRFLLLSLGGDVRVRFQSFLLMFEVAHRQIRHDDAHRGRNAIDAQAFNADERTTAGYILVGYRLPLLEVMPYVQFDFLTKTMMFFAGGLNARPIETVTLKAQFTHVRPLYDARSNGLPEEAFHALELQAAWVF